MGSWNALCLTIRTETPDDLAADFEPLLERDWQSLTADITLPDDAPSLEDRPLSPDDFRVKTRDKHVYCYAGGHSPAFHEMEVIAYAFLAHLEPEEAVITKRFEDGQGSSTLYQHLDSASEHVLQHRDRVDGIGYAKVTEISGWELPRGAEHAANVIGTRCGMDVGIAESDRMYVLDVRRHRL
ncbi:MULTISPECIES: hypothetical protein [Halorussus]|uniref:hypothetical protein n=1 Tax=Halorussus TaxID=1070314 RepID=UPI00209E95A6|nr:hypothetical protein [Halorussus vallis]USZ74501.1 hypothetical protein NGM07_13740 [Halorussus vallis]